MIGNKRNRKTDVKKDCQPKQSAGDKLPPEEKKIIEQDENDCKTSGCRILGRGGEKRTRASGDGRGIIRNPGNDPKNPGLEIKTEQMGDALDPT